MPNKTLIVGSVSSPVDVNVTGTLTAPTPTSGSSNTQVATKGYVDGAIAPEVFVITIDSLQSTITADHTFAEIVAAFYAGKIVLLSDNDGNSQHGAQCYPLVQLASNKATFCYINATGKVAYWQCSSNDAWTYSSFGVQTRIIVSGILKGDGTGGVAAAVAGTDYAAASHNHDASNITSGTLGVARGGTGQTSLQATRNAMGLGNTTGALPVANGGTGATTLTSGYALIGNGTNAVATRAITNNTATTTALTANTNLITANTLRYHTNRTTSVAAADTNYTTYMARGESLNSASTTPTVNGTIAWQYE